MHRLLVVLAIALPFPLIAQTPVAQADSLIRSGAPWRASELLTPYLDSAATPDVVMVAARAAAGWEGWAQVRRLLSSADWIASRYDRLGARLLAEADLALDDSIGALAAAHAAVGDSAQRDATEEGRRFVLLARAFDRLHFDDSAAAAYRMAAHFLPALDDWLALRAAVVARDSATRDSLYASVALPAARPRILWTEAAARDRDSDFAGAAIRYDSLGDRVAALKERWRGASDDSSRRAVADSVVLAIHGANAAVARNALDLIGTFSVTLSRDQHLVVARRAAVLGRNTDAVSHYDAAARDTALAASDRITYAAALGALQQWSDAADQLAGITDPEFAGEAAYFHARALLRAGQDADAIRALRRVVARYPHDTVAGPTALHLLADLAIDSGKTHTARTDYLNLAARFPRSAQRGHAILIAALIAYADRDARTAAHELARAITAHAIGDEVDAARYWLGRAWWSTGDSAAARNEWRTLLARGAENYYAVRAAARLDTMPWPALHATTPAAPDSLDGLFARAELLDSLGLAPEARLERDRIYNQAHGRDAERVAAAFLDHGFTSRAAQLANRAAAAGAPRDSTLWPLLYPFPFANALRADAAREGVDPFLVASVIRQESNFEPHATSRTDARGLMQVEPATGRDLARALALPDFDPAWLWIAPVNLALGIHHFATAMERYPEVERGLAAYNAGVSRVDHWSSTPLSGKVRPAAEARDSLADAELFVERIPFVETRDYVRAIIRNESVYRMIYDK